MAYCISKKFKLKVSPLQILRALEKEKHPFFLDSSLCSKEEGRFSFLGANPFCVVTAKEEEPFVKLRAILSQYNFTSRNGYPFCGGAVGFLSYDIGFLLEDKLRKTRIDDVGIPDALFGVYNTVIAVDNLKRELEIISWGIPETSQRLAKALAKDNLAKTAKLLDKINSIPVVVDKKKIMRATLSSNFSKDSYIRAVNKAKRYIKEGDIYQVNLSQRFESESPIGGVEMYGRLRKISPSNFSAYFDGGDYQILSSSPERYLSVRGNRVLTRPMKGTRSRGKSARLDNRLRRELLASAKDKAELMMIVDLERNDLGRVCHYDSVKVRSLRQLEKYATVYQTTATIEGRLFEGKDRLDLLRAAFPGGSITGCPKIRAMEIIEELEPTRRNIYTGALGYLSFCGNMDFNILIRSILKKGNKLYFGAGGGIVADSDPAAEYEETLVKASAMLRTIGTPF